MMEGTEDEEKNPLIGVYRYADVIEVEYSVSLPQNSLVSQIYFLLEQKEKNRISHYYECGMVNVHWGNKIHGLGGGFAKS